jgi:hypothetical protein
MSTLIHNQNNLKLSNISLANNKTQKNKSGKYKKGNIFFFYRLFYKIRKLINQNNTGIANKKYKRHLLAIKHKNIFLQTEKKHFPKKYRPF